MTILESYYIYLLLISNAVLVAAAAIAVTRFQRQRIQLEHEWNSATSVTQREKKTEQARQHLLITMRLERLVKELQTQMSSVVRKERVPDPVVERHLPIENAVRMAKNGASVEDLARTCGLNIGEARLMKKVHARASTNATA